jgi:hypothetical protein
VTARELVADQSKELTPGSVDSPAEVQHPRRVSSLTTRLTALVAVLAVLDEHVGAVCRLAEHGPSTHGVLRTRSAMSDALRRQRSRGKPDRGDAGAGRHLLRPL